MAQIGPPLVDGVALWCRASLDGFLSNGRVERAAIAWVDLVEGIDYVLDGTVDQDGGSTRGGLDFPLDDVDAVAGDAGGGDRLLGGRGLESC